jgi:type VI secretion system protein ImpL
MGSVARTINERLLTVQSTMRMDFPTYVLLTKCDSVSYFQEFFAHLNDTESRQILGVTLPFSKPTNEYADAYADREGSRLTKLLNRLYQSIADRRLVFLAREEVVERRALAYEFPRELKKVRGEIVQFLLDAFRPSTLHSPCRLRGFYFSGKRLVPRAVAATDSTSTSTDQSIVKRPTEATVFFQSSIPSSTLDYSLIARKPGESTTPKWTFLTQVFREIVLADPASKSAQALVPIGDSKYVSFALGAAGATCLLLSVLWVFSWKKNHDLLNEVQTAVVSTRPVTSAAPLETLPELESLRPLMVTLHMNEREGAPLYSRWGLYAGNRAASDLDSLYYTRFRQAILDPTLGAMSGLFLQLQPGSPVNADIYKELKSYRTMTSGSCPPDVALVTSTVLPVWSDAVSRDPDTQALAEKQILFYGDELKIADPYNKHLPESNDAVQRAQSYLINLTGPEKILQSLLIQVSQKQHPERLGTYASNYSLVLTGPDQMDSSYTSAGWKMVEDSIRDHKLDVAGEPCVVGGNNTGVSKWAGDAAMDAQVQKLYSDAYVLNWKQFLAAHHVIPFNGTADAATKLRTLADNSRSPLLALVYMTSANTNVAPSESARDRASDAIHDVASGTKKAIAGAMSKIGGGAKDSAPQPTDSATTANTTSTLPSAFTPVHNMVNPGSGDNWVNEKNHPYIKALADLSDALQTLPMQVHSDVPLETQELQQAKTTVAAADSALHTLAADFPNTPSGVDIDLQRLLREPIDYARKTVASVELLKASALVAGGAAAPVAAPADPKAGAKQKEIIKQVNVSALALCSAIDSLQKKFPFDATSTTDATLDDLNSVFQPGTGAYSQFSTSPDVSKAYNHTGRTWAAKPEFQANFSQPFLFTLNTLGEVEDELYGGGSPNPHIDLTLTVDGTGKIPFELDVDGHTIKFTPGKPAPSLKLVWPPITNAPAHLIFKSGAKGGSMPAQFAGLWGLFHLLQAADDQSGTVFTFRNVQFAHSLIPLTNEKGVPGTIQIRVESAASNIFSRGYLAKTRCSEAWALQGESLGP